MDNILFENTSQILDEYETISNVFLDNETELIGFSLNTKEFYLLLNTNRYSFPFILTKSNTDYPHLIKIHKKIEYKSVCLFNNFDYVNSTVTQEDKIRIVIEQLIKLESLSKREISEEYLKEFPIYWSKVSNKSNETRRLFLDDEDEKEYEWLNTYFYGKKNSRTIRYSSEKIIFNDDDTKLGFDNQKALYVKVINTELLLPPINGKRWDASNIINIFCNTQIERISSRTFSELKRITYSKKKLFIVFCINGFYVACDVIFKNAGAKKLFYKIENEIVDVIPYDIKRCDYKYLSEQIGNDISLINKKVLLIGLGSLGSYIADELIKAGCINLTIYDNDRYEPSNILRHKYPLSLEGINKTRIGNYYLTNYHPQIIVNSYDKAYNNTEDITNYDIIISTVGSSDKQLEFNEEFNKSFIGKPVLFSWLEGDGKSSHVLCTYNNGKGCFNCCFCDENGKTINNKMNISDPQKTVYKINSCGGTRVAYGTTTLLTATYITLLAVKDTINNSDKVPFIYSFTDNCISKQQDFCSEGCSICNENRREML